jgi:DNA-binding FadR family transcriptional regulator
LNSQQISAADTALAQLRSLLDANADRSEWRLPGERDLALELSLGRRAIRSALGVLEAEQRVWRRQGKGPLLASVQPFRTTSSRPWPNGPARSK